MRTGQFNVRHLLIIVAGTAVVLCYAKGTWAIVEKYGINSPYGLGMNSGLLGPGQAVVLHDDYRAALASSANMHDYREPPWRDYAIATGTRGTVQYEPAWDADSCNKDRPIAVQLTGGEHKGLVVCSPRRFLREL